VADNQINGQTSGQINGPGRGHQAAGGVGSVKAKEWLQPFQVPDEFNGVPGETGSDSLLVVGPCYGLDYHFTMPKVTLMLPTIVEPP
jgi:hypothetical protein